MILLQLSGLIILMSSPVTKIFKFLSPFVFNNNIMRDIKNIISIFNLNWSCSSIFLSVVYIYIYIQGTPKTRPPSPPSISGTRRNFIKVENMCTINLRGPHLVKIISRTGGIGSSMDPTFKFQVRMLSCDISLERSGRQTNKNCPTMLFEKVMLLLYKVQGGHN